MEQGPREWVEEMGRWGSCSLNLQYLWSKINSHVNTDVVLRLGLELGDFVLSISETWGSGWMATEILLRLSESSLIIWSDNRDSRDCRDTPVPCLSGIQLAHLSTAPQASGVWGCRLWCLSLACSTQLCWKPQALALTQEPCFQSSWSKSLLR